MPVDPDAFLARWHVLVAAKDPAALSDVLAEDVTMGAPPYWQDFEGVEVVQHLLGLVIETIEGFSYHREWVDGRELALEFKGRVGDIDLQGIDLITLDDAGRLCHLDVLIRPMNALEALRERIMPRMTAFFSERGAAAS